MELIGIVIALVILAVVIRLLVATGKLAMQFFFPALMAFLFGIGFAMIGAFFGPVGALIGFVWGLIAGWQFGMKKKAASAAKATTNSRSYSSSGSSRSSSYSNMNDSPSGKAHWAQMRCQQCNNVTTHKIDRTNGHRRCCECGFGS